MYEMKCENICEEYVLLTYEKMHARIVRNGNNCENQIITVKNIAWFVVLFEVYGVIHVKLMFTSINETCKVVYSCINIHRQLT